MMRLALAIMLLASCAGWTRSGKDESSVAFQGDAEVCASRIAFSLGCPTFETCRDRPNETWSPDRHQGTDSMRAMRRCLEGQGWER